MTTHRPDSYDVAMTSMLKEAGAIGRTWAGAKGFVQGFQNAGKAQELHRANEVLQQAGRKTRRTPGANPIKPMAPADSWMGRVQQRIDAGSGQVAKAQKTYDKEQRIAEKQRADAAEAARVQAAEATARQAGYAVREPKARDAAQPKARDAAQPPSSPDPAAPGSGSGSGNFMAKALGTAALGAGGYALYNGLRDADEQRARAQDYYNSAQHNLMAPISSMTVTASYEKFAEEKSSENWFAPVLLGNAQAAVAKSLADTVGQRLVGDPLSALGDTIKKRYLDEPKWQKNFDDVVASDPHLQQMHQQNPSVLPSAFETIKRFSPTLAKDRLATRSLLRHVAMSGGEMDFGTMKMLAETEKFHNESKRK